jgi:hypothetical protein
MDLKETFNFQDYSQIFSVTPKKDVYFFSKETLLTAYLVFVTGGCEFRTAKILQKKVVNSRIFLTDLNTLEK